MYVILRFSIANVPADAIVASAILAGISGTLQPNLGFTPTWGMEPGHTLETAVPAAGVDAVLSWAAGLCAEHAESCVYLTSDGTSPRLVWSDGRVTLLDADTVVRRVPVQHYVSA